QRPEVEAAGVRLVQGLVEQSRLDAGDADPVPGLLEAAVAAIEASFDPANGGWGRAPKFPQPMTIEFLLRRHLATGDARPLAIARRSLDAMADGGIHDQLGGGFHRYATDARWLVPHFEQMLYDNAQLARVYLHAWQVTGDARYRDVATGTLDYIARELTTGDGAFAASQDADTDGEEGATFVWTAEEIRELLGDGAPLVETAYGVTDSGNWEGRTILSRVVSDAELAGRFELTEAEVSQRLGDARRALLARRDGRHQPARDGKALAAWNGLAIAAFADAAVALSADDPASVSNYRTAAVRAASAIVDGLLASDGSLSRSWKDGRAVGRGVLEDHAHLAEGLLSLYEATFDEHWFTTARALVDRILGRFADPDGGFFDTADDHERLVTRPKDVQDNALPSGNAVAAEVLLRVHAWTGESIYRAAAERALRTVVPYVARYATGFARWLSAIDLSLAAVQEVAIVGRADDRETLALLGEVRRGYRPNQVIALAADSTGSAVPLLDGRVAIAGRPSAYLCRGFVCGMPATDPGTLRRQLEEPAGAA
ncbi:MAG: thioredoxin domain-containing protein, partial [Candidatus Limnocylindrales bacterium]